MYENTVKWDSRLVYLGEIGFKGFRTVNKHNTILTSNSWLGVLLTIKVINICLLKFNSIFLKKSWEWIAARDCVFDLIQC